MAVMRALVAGCVLIVWGVGAMTAMRLPTTAGAAAPQDVQPTTAPSAPASPSGAPQPPATGSLLGPPPVQFDPPLLDLGTLRPGAKTSGTIMVHNISDKWLLIKDSKASCTCTAISLANTSIAPGQAVPLEVGYHASSLMGEKAASVRILFEGYDLIETPIRALVALPVRSDPMYINALKREDGEQTLSGQFTVYASDQRPFRVLAINGKPPEFVEFDPGKDQPRDTYVLRWDLTGYDPGTCKNAAGERMPGWIVVETDHPEAPMFDLEVRHACNLRRPVTQMDNWALQDKRVLVGVMKLGESVETEVEVKWIPRRSRQDPPSAIVSESPLFTIEMLGVTPHEETMSVQLRITAAKDARGFMYGAARLHSNRQNAPLVVIGSVRE
jgi:hypothetical protein